MAIPIKQKNKVFGETFNVGELIEALKNEVFKVDDAPVSIHTEDFFGDVVAVYKRKNHEGVYILANNRKIYSEDDDNEEDEGEDDMFIFNTDEVSGSVKEIAETIYGLQYIIEKKDLIEILNKLDKKQRVMIETMADENAYTLTGVYKCSEGCPAIHLDSSYEEVNFNLN